MAETVTVRDFALEWLRRERHRLKPRSVESYEAVLEQHLLPRLGVMPLAAVTREVVRDLLLSKREAGYASATVALWLAVLRAVFNAALDDGLLNANPCTRIGRLLPRKKGPLTGRALNGDEFRGFLAALGEHQLRPLFIVGIRTGMRLGELLGLRWDDVNLPARTVTVRHSLDERGRLGSPKGGQVVSLPLSREAHDALENLERSRNGTPWVFAGPHSEPWSRSEIRRVMWVACDKASIQRRSPHDLRRAFLTSLAENGVNPWALKALARHASIQTTERYLSPTHALAPLVEGLDGQASVEAVPERLSR